MWWNRPHPTVREPTNDPEDGEGKMPLRQQETICGLRRKVFFFVILGGVFIAVVAIAIGVGAGIAFNKGSSYVVSPIFPIESLPVRERTEIDSVLENPRRESSTPHPKYRAPTPATPSCAPTTTTTASAATSTTPSRPAPPTSIPGTRPR